jgi:adenylosuccinate synthase
MVRLLKGFLRLENFSSCKPVYETFPGWGEFEVEDWSKLVASGYDSLPSQLRDYVEFIEKFTKTPVKLMSYGPARRHTFIK